MYNIYILILYLYNNCAFIYIYFLCVRMDDDNTLVLEDVQYIHRKTSTQLYVVQNYCPMGLQRPQTSGCRDDKSHQNGSASLDHNEIRKL